MSIADHEASYKSEAWHDYTLEELGNWVHLLAKRSEHRSDVIKQAKDLQDAENYLEMMQKKLDYLKQKRVGGA